jgi:hypothetical protein
MEDGELGNVVTSNAQFAIFHNLYLCSRNWNTNFSDWI